MQGGHHPKLDQAVVSGNCSGISKNKFPQINIHGFSPSEFIHFREVFFNEPLDRIIDDFSKGRDWDPFRAVGGEILVDSRAATDSHP